MFEATMIAIGLVGAAALAFGIAALRSNSRQRGYKVDDADGRHDD